MPLDKTPWTDETIIEWGDHKGKAMKDVPATYKAWLLEQKHWIADWPGLNYYLRKNQHTIIAEAEKSLEAQGNKEGYDSYEDYRRDVRG